MSIKINVELVHHLVSTQFPQWKNLSIKPVDPGGWDNKTFRLGKDMLVRMPSAFDYSMQVEKEHRWLPNLSPFLPLQVPAPLGIGQPSGEYPWKWSIYQWIEGEVVSSVKINDLSGVATDLAKFLIALQNIDTTGGPQPGLHNFYRGGDLKIYDEQTRKAIDILKNKIDVKVATRIWETALMTTWELKPVWAHGDISPGNLLVKDGKLSAVIDFGVLAVGDPACDLAIAWTLFEGEGRDVFRRELSLDAGAWLRGQAWALWKALIVAADLIQAPASEKEQCWSIINKVMRDDRFS